MESNGISQKYLNNTETFISDEENHGMNVEQNFDASNLPLQ